MVFKFQCDLILQDCAKLYPPTASTPVKLPFTNQSCVRDARLEGNIGRCGFPNAPCLVQSRNDNCAGGGDMTFTYNPVCKNGVCRGEAGAVCAGNVECNWGFACNNSFAQNLSGVCGGSGAYMKNSEAADGLDFARDYCLSGKAYQNSVGYWLCSAGAPMALTVPPPTALVARSKGSSIQAIVIGLCVAIVAIAIVLAAYILWRKRRRPLEAHQTGNRVPMEDFDGASEPDNRTTIAASLGSKSCLSSATRPTLSTYSSTSQPTKSPSDGPHVSPENLARSPSVRNAVLVSHGSTHELKMDEQRLLAVKEEADRCLVEIREKRKLIEQGLQDGADRDNRAPN